MISLLYIIFKIILHYNGSRGNMAITLSMSAAQARAFDERIHREFVPIVSERALIGRIESAKSIGEIEQLSVSYGLCDCCDLRLAKYESAVMLAKLIAKISYRFPKLRSRFCFLGTKAGFIYVLNKIRMGDLEMISRFRLERICDQRQISRMANDVLAIMCEVKDTTSTNILANASSSGGFFDALIIDQGDFGEMGYDALCKMLREKELSGNAAKGCGRPASVVFHECGHLLDYLCGISNDPEFLQYYRSFTKKQISENVSDYAATGPDEFLAEAFSEFMCSYAPRETARWVYAFTKEKYRRL